MSSSTTILSKPAFTNDYFIFYGWKCPKNDWLEHIMYLDRSAKFNQERFVSWFIFPTVIEGRRLISL